MQRHKRVKMTLEKEMIRLFDAKETEKKENEKNLSREKCCLLKPTFSLQPKKCFISHAPNDRKLKRRERRSISKCISKNEMHFWTRLRNKYSCSNIGSFSMRTIVFLLYSLHVVSRSSTVAYPYNKVIACLFARSLTMQKCTNWAEMFNKDFI